MLGKVLVTGSAGHLGQALVMSLRERGVDVVGLDVMASPWTDVQGSISDPECVEAAMQGVQTVMHTATLHKPHVATHSRQRFVDTNITGTLHLLEAALKCGVRAFVFTSTTSAFGDALRPRMGDPAAWITEEVVPKPKNIYGATKTAAEDLCQLFHRNFDLPCIVLRTSRFFPEPDDDEQRRASMSDQNLKAVEFLYRRVDVEDIVSAHVLAAQHVSRIGFDRFIISAPTPFEKTDVALLRRDPAQVLRERVPGYETLFSRLGWALLCDIDRVYVCERAIKHLGWQPKTDFMTALHRAAEGQSVLSPLACKIGIKGYHGGQYADGLYPVS
jgi:UDP-glucose 4-epimerase